MDELIRKKDVVAIIDGRFSGLMIGDILKNDVAGLPTVDVKQIKYFDKERASDENQDN